MLLRLVVLTLFATVIGCAGKTQEESGGSAAATSEGVSSATSTTYDDFIAQQPYSGEIAMPDNSWSPVLITVAARSSPEAAGTMSIHVCDSDDLVACAANAGAPPMPFTLDPDRDADHWQLNLRNVRSDTPVRTHSLTYESGHLIIQMDLPATTASRLIGIGGS